MQLSIFDEVEIYMHIQPSARSGDVDSAAEQFLIAKKIGHICDKRWIT